VDNFKKARHMPGLKNKSQEVIKMPEEPKLAEELKKMEYEEFLPVEKKLVTWSIVLGILLLGILIWVSYTFFPAEH
jgi:hypothetical protein